MSPTAPATPRIRLRQVALVAADLDAAEREVIDGLGLSMCFRDPGVAEFGLRNALFPVGDGLLEIVSPTRPDTTAGRFLDRRGGDGGYMVILQTDEDLDDVRARLADLDARVVFTAHGDGVTGLHVHPRDVGGALVSIDRTDAWTEWPWAGPDWPMHVRTGTADHLHGVEIATADPAVTAARWGAALGRDVSQSDPPTIELDDDTFVRFVRAGDRGDGVDAIVVRSARHPLDRRIVGCAVRSSPMIPDRPVPGVDALADRVFGAIEAGDLDRVAALWADDIEVWHNTDGVVQTKAQNLATLQWFVDRTTARRYEVLERHATTSGFVQRHVLHLDLPNGAGARLDAALFVRVHDGQVTRIDEYLDAAQVADAFRVPGTAREP
jgi:ketosteroid isomerase-like protein